MLSLRELIEDNFGLTETSNKNEFYSVNDWEFANGRPMYGGQLAAQSLACAVLTTDQGFVVHSLHSYFVNAGKIFVPVTFSVKVVRNGGGFCIRSVTAKQNGVTIFIMLCSFQRLPTKKSIGHQAKMPDVLPVLDKTTEYGRMVQEERCMTVQNYPVDTDIMMMKRVPISSRLAVPADPSLQENFKMGVNDHLNKLYAKKQLNDSVKQLRLPYNLRWMRVNKQIPVVDSTSASKNSAADNVNIHILLLTLLSDFRITLNAYLPHFFGYNYERNRSTMSTSLDHTVHFHSYEGLDTSKWHLFELESHRVKNSRGMTLIKIYNSETGVHVATVSQEHLLKSVPNTEFSGVGGEVPDFMFVNSPPRHNVPDEPAQNANNSQALKLLAKL